MPWWVFLIIIAAVMALVFFFLYRKGKKIQAQQAEQMEQMEAAKQTVSLLVIDKKKTTMKNAGFPQVVLDNLPRLARNRRFPVVKGKVGPKIMTFITDKKIYDQIPLKKEIKADVSGLYIVSVRGIRGNLVSKDQKKKGRLETLLEKGRGEA